MTTSAHRFTFLTATRAIASLFGIIFTIQCGSAATFWVSPDGNDSKVGSKSLPFASIRRAQQSVKAGDTVFIRGGTYHLKEADIMEQNRFIASIFLLNKDGKKDSPISYFACPGERPIFDCSEVKPQGQRISAFRVYGSWIHIKGLEVKGVQVTATGHTQSICFDNSGNHNIYENLAMHDGQAIGVYIIRGSDNLVLNCDAWNNHDYTSEGGRGGNTDGFGCHVPRGGENNVFKGCRAWFNSDDGFDCINSGSAVTFIDCWSFNNGYSTDFKRLGDGNGFKAGGYGINPGTQFPDPIPRHRVGRCLAVNNRSAGFYANHHPGGIDWIHNTAFKNAINYNFLGRNSTATEDMPGQGHKILNNLSYGGKKDLANLAPEGNQRSGNSFDLNVKFADADFISLDVAVLTAPRKADGSLPDLRLLRPIASSPLIKTGIPASISHKGEALDLGIFDADITPATADRSH